MSKENDKIEKIESDKNNDSGKTRNAKKGKGFTIFIAILILLIVAVIGVSVFMFMKQKKQKDELKSISLDEYTKKALQYKEIDFSKFLIYGTSSTDPEKDCMLIYFLKGTAMLQFKGLDRISIDYENSKNQDLHLIYKISKGETELPIDIEIVYDENKCRLVENINANPLNTGKLGKCIEIISTVVGGGAGGVVGNLVGGLFGMKGKVIGTLAGATIGGTGTYLFSSNYSKKTSLVIENTAEDIGKIRNEAEPIIAAQLLYDDYLADREDNESEKEYFQRQIANILASIIIDKTDTEKSRWKSVSVNFVEESEEEGVE